MLCIYLKTCPMYDTSIGTNNPALSEKWKGLFCRNNPELCARKCIQEALGQEAVPLLMLPQQYAWAQQILEDHNISYAKIHELLPSPVR